MFVLRLQSGVPNTSAPAKRRFPAPWRVVEIPGGFKIEDAAGRSLAYIYSRPDLANVVQPPPLTQDEARRIAAGIARLPELLKR